MLTIKGEPKPKKTNGLNQVLMEHHTENANLDALVVPSSIRHTMAKWLRQSGVASWHTSAQLGHTKRGSEITEIYAPNDPSYLADCVLAIEEYFDSILHQSQKLKSFMDGLK